MVLLKSKFSISIKTLSVQCNVFFRVVLKILRYFENWRVRGLTYFCFRLFLTFRTRWCMQVIMTQVKGMGPTPLKN